MLEINLHAKDVTAGRIELELVVIAEPVIFGTSRNCPDWRQPAGAKDRLGTQQSGQRLAAR